VIWRGLRSKSPQGERIKQPHTSVSEMNIYA
jgi:hypothetical protein